MPPVTCAQIGLSLEDKASIATLIEGTLAFPFIGNMPVEVTAEGLRQALAEMDRLGNALIEAMGDVPYQSLHG